MEPRKPQFRPFKKNLSRFRLPVIPRVKQKSLFEEYYYAILGVFCCVVVLLLTAGGMGFYDAFVIGLWIGAMTLFVTQVVRYLRYRNSPAEENPLASQGIKIEAQPATKKTKTQAQPAKPVPSVKDAPSIALVPKPGQAPRPPIITGSAKPSPFIKPPK
jgi:hypothetical protein